MIPYRLKNCCGVSKCYICLMRSDPAYRKITADEFLAMDFGTDRKFELEDGVIVMMAWGTDPHAWVQGNIFTCIEVLSPSTTTLDQGTKLEQYKTLPSIRTIGFVDPINEMTRVIERMPQGWLEYIFSGDRGIEIPTLGLVIPHGEIFAPE